MATAVTILRRSGLGLGAVVSALSTTLVADHLLAPRTTKRVTTRHQFYDARPGADPNAVMVGFHGLWATDWYDQQAGYLSGRGHLLALYNGARVGDSPAAAITQLIERELLDHSLCVSGFSMGTGTAVRFLRLYRKIMGYDAPYAFMVCGPAAPQHVLWPQPWLPGVLRNLPTGPSLELFWQQFLAARIAKDVPVASRAHSAAVISGARQLQVGPQLKEGEFAGTEAVFIEHEGDHRVKGCYPAWREAFPNSRLILIPRRTNEAPGDSPPHGDVDRYPEAYRAAYESLPWGKLVAA